MDHFFESAAARMGDQISGDHLKLVVCVITSLPLTVVYRTLPPKSPTIRHLFFYVLCNNHNDICSQILYGCFTHCPYWVIHLCLHEILPRETHCLYQFYSRDDKFIDMVRKKERK